MRSAGISVKERQWALLRADRAHSLAMPGEIPRLAVFLSLITSVVSWVRLSPTRRVGDGRVVETLGRKPSRLCPKPEALAELSCRTAVLSGTAVGRRTHPFTIKPNLWVLSPAPRGAGHAPTPWSGTPFIRHPYGIKHGSSYREMPTRPGAFQD